MVDFVIEGDFSAGMRQDILPMQLPSGACEYCANVVFSKKSIAVRPGFVQFSDLPAATTTGARALAMYTPITPGESLKRLVAICADKAYVTKSNDQKFSSYDTIALGLSTSNRARAMQFNQSMYAVDGVGPVKKFLNLTNWRMGGSVWTTDATAISAASSYYGLAIDATYVWATVAASNKLVRFTRSSGGAGTAYTMAQIYNPSSVMVDDANIRVLNCVDSAHATTAAIATVNSSGTLQGTLPILWGRANDKVLGPVDFAKNSTNGFLYILDSGYLSPINNSVVRSSNVVTVGTTSAHNFIVGDKVMIAAADTSFNGTFTIATIPTTTSFTFSQVGANATATAKGSSLVTQNRVSVWDAAGNFQFNFAQTQITDNSFSSLRDPRGICCHANGDVFIVDAKGYILRFSSTGTYKSIIGYQEMYVPIGIACIGDSLYVYEYDKNVSVYSIDGQRIGQIPRTDQTSTAPNSHYGIAGDANAIYVIDGGKSSIEKYAQTASDNYQSLLSLPTPSSPPAVVLQAGSSGSYLVSGDYAMATAYNIVTGYTTDAGPMSSQSIFSVAENTTRILAVTVTVDTSLLSKGDTISLLLQSPYNASYMEIKKWTWDGVTTQYTLSWIGPTPATSTEYIALDVAEIWSFAVAPPPKAATILKEWKGRMVYVAPFPFGSSTVADTLYISNMNDAEHCPIDTQVDAPASYGTYVRVGTDGGAVTALARLGSYLVVFKERSVWLLDGDGWQDYRLMQINATQGCLAHEMVCEVENMLMFCSTDSVWSFDGQSFAEIGISIKRQLNTFTVASRRLGSIVYNPLKRKVHLMIPTAYPEARPSSGGFTYDLTNGAWAYTLGLPAASLVYLHNMTVPGVYAGDNYGLAGAGKVYLLDTGTTDSSSNGDGLQISWGWSSRLFFTPFEGQYKDIQEIVFDLLNISENNDLGINIIVNGSSVATRALTIPATEGVPRLIRWRPVRAADVWSYHLSIGGNSTEAFEIMRITIRASARGSH